MSLKTVKVDAFFWAHLIYTQLRNAHLQWKVFLTETLPVLKIDQQIQKVIEQSHTYPQSIGVDSDTVVTLTRTAGHTYTHVSSVHSAT